MKINSETILTTQTHPGDSTMLVVTGDAYKGDGYYRQSDGIHTVQYTYTNFSGIISIQATLAVTPDESDWFDAHVYETHMETASKIQNIVGNYVWIRAQVIYFDGTVNLITYNH